VRTFKIHVHSDGRVWCDRVLRRDGQEHFVDSWLFPALDDALTYGQVFVDEGKVPIDPAWEKFIDDMMKETL
jgi:hypothetical protein